MRRFFMLLRALLRRRSYAREDIFIYLSQKEYDMPQSTEKYKLITGKDDAEFCKRITKLLTEGYELYGSPSIAFNGEHMVVAQAVTKLDTPLI